MLWLAKSEDLLSVVSNNIVYKHICAIFAPALVWNNTGLTVVDFVRKLFCYIRFTKRHSLLLSQFRQNAICKITTTMPRSSKAMAKTENNVFFVSFSMIVTQTNIVSHHKKAPVECFTEITCSVSSYNNHSLGIKPCSGDWCNMP